QPEGLRCRLPRPSGRPRPGQRRDDDPAGRAALVLVLHGDLRPARAVPGPWGPARAAVPLRVGPPRPPVTFRHLRSRRAPSRPAAAAGVPLVIQTSHEEANMVELRLDDEARRVLADTLEIYLSDLRMEISHTDRLDFRNMLKKKRSILESVLQQLRPAGVG